MEEQGAQSALDGSVRQDVFVGIVADAGEWTVDLGLEKS